MIVIEAVHFTNSTGKFTIPVTGDYAFYCTVMYTTASIMDHLTFKLNGATLTASNDHNGGGSTYGQRNGMVVHYVIPDTLMQMTMLDLVSQVRREY